MKFFPRRDKDSPETESPHAETQEAETPEAGTPEAAEGQKENRPPGQHGAWRPFRKPTRARRGPWQQGNEAGVHAFLILMVLAMLAGPAALAMHVLAPSRTTAEGTQTGTGSASADPGAETQATGAAEALVAVWLRASREDIDHLNTMLVTPADERWLPKERPKAPESVIATDARLSAEGEWVVTVKATGGSRGRETYRVLIAPDLSNPLAVTLPSLVADVSHTVRPIEQEELRSDHPAVQAVDGFGRALLTGETDLERWLAPDAEIPAVSPAPCVELATAVTATAAVPETPAGADHATVVATYTCSADEDVVRTTQYVLDLQGRDGRWEVLALGDRFGDSEDDTSESPATPPVSPPSSPSPSAPR